MILGIYSALTILAGIVAVLGPIGTIVAVIVSQGAVIPTIKVVVMKFLGCRTCIVVVTIIVASLVSFWIGNHDAYQRGVDDTVAKIARGDATLVDRARKARSRLLECQSENRTWDQTTGRCR